MKAGIKVFAPASVANVACGFDIMGFALNAPGDEIIARPNGKSCLSIKKITGDGGKLPLAIEKNTGGYAAQQFLNFLGKGDLGIELEIHKKMPFGSGLGSSAASAAGAVVAVNELLGRPLSRTELLPFAVEGEQIADGAYHADNVAPSLLGGLILIRDTKTLDFYRISTPVGLTAVVVYPHIEILTKDARDVISDTISLEQHILQSGNLAGLIYGFLQSNFEAIRSSLKDYIVEPQRSKLIPHFDEVKSAAIDNGALGCSISGAGPSIFALCSSSIEAERVGNSMQSIFTREGIYADLFISLINQEGTKVY